MTLDNVNFNTSYLDTGMMNMFSNPMLTTSSMPVFDFSQYMPGSFNAMDSFGLAYGSYSDLGYSNFNFNFNFEMPKFDMNMLMDMYNATMQGYKAQMNKLQEMLNLNFSWNTTPTASLKDVNYNAEAAKKLAQNAKSHAGASSQKRCAKFVSDAIEASGIQVTRGHAYQMENNLRNNPNFKEVKVSQSELTSLPAGCILVYPKGAAGYSSKYGHIEITLGNGKAASDFINNNPKYASNMKVFVPVTA